jgi:general secretion pathway protein A
MDYYKILNLKREPFSNSPDPDYFYKSRQHLSCLQKLEIALRLQRGLNIVVGHVGTGKTTLCRQLIRRLSVAEGFETHLILDPSYGTPSEFLLSVFEMLSGGRLTESVDDWRLKEKIKQHLFRKGIDENKIVVLIIDEGQKIPPFCIELLREFLNYETNDHKLLQIALFAQQEFERILAHYPNFADRVNLYHRLEPMNFRDTRQMIQHRLKQSSQTPKPPALFTYSAYLAIYRASRGYPRKIVNLCHQSVLAMIIQNRSRASHRLVNSCRKRAIAGSWQRSYQLFSFFFLMLILSFGAWIWIVPQPYSALHLLGRGRAAFETRPAYPISPQPTIVKIEVPASDKPVLPVAVISTKVGMDRLPAAANTLHSDMPNEDLHRLKTDPADIGLAPGAETRKPSISDRPPEILGVLRMQRGGTLTRMIRHIRGDFSKPYLQQLLKLNPMIADPNSIEEGTAITFPSAPASAPPANPKVHWIELGNKNSLEEAYAQLLAFEPEKKTIRLVPYWNPHDGLRFAIVLSEFFSDPLAAASGLRLLPAKLSGQSKIVSGWDVETLFFTNLF